MRTAGRIECRTQALWHWASHWTDQSLKCVKCERKKQKPAFHFHSLSACFWAPVMCRAQRQSSWEDGILTGCQFQVRDCGGVRAVVCSAVSTPSVGRAGLWALCRGAGEPGGSPGDGGETATRLISSQLGSRQLSRSKGSYTSYSESCD